MKTILITGSNKGIGFEIAWQEYSRFNNSKIQG
jgi:short-subunit dehydrogenase involved in D-alanine esterification of teichoic acids